MFLTLEANYQLDFRTGELSDLIGFNKEIATATKYHSKKPDITRTINSLAVQSSTISNSIVSGQSSDVLYMFSIDDLKASFSFDKEVRRFLSSKINTDCIRNIKFYILNQKDRAIDLNVIEVSMNIMIET